MLACGTATKKADRPEVWIWQGIVAHHMLYWAEAVAACGFAVTFVADRAMSKERSELGWTAPQPNKIRVLVGISPDQAVALARGSAQDSVHICPGVKSGGVSGAARAALIREGRGFWTIMETVDPRGWKGLFKRQYYAYKLSNFGSALKCVLAIGRDTDKWVVQCGVKPVMVFPFAYFLSRESHHSSEGQEEDRSVFRIIYIGQLVTRKRLDLLFEALASLVDHDFEVHILGSGSEENRLRSAVVPSLRDRVVWRGVVPMDSVHSELAAADCLVLPSDHDGWGAVVSEALLAGTPAICSSACGASEVVISSGVGGVFTKGSVSELRSCLLAAIRGGRQSRAERDFLSNWARSLDADAGATYFAQIHAYLAGEATGPRPVPPWRREVKSGSNLGGTGL